MEGQIVYYGGRQHFDMFPYFFHHWLKKWLITGVEMDCSYLVTGRSLFDSADEFLGF